MALVEPVRHCGAWHDHEAHVYLDEGAGSCPGGPRESQEPMQRLPEWRVTSTYFGYVNEEDVTTSEWTVVDYVGATDELDAERTVNLLARLQGYRLVERSVEPVPPYMESLAELLERMYDDYQYTDDDGGDMVWPYEDEWGDR